MIRKINLQISLTIVILFVLLQLASLLYFSNNYFTVYGPIHFGLFGIFIIFFLMLTRIQTKQIYLLILLYHLFLVLGFFFFYTEFYNNPLGFEPTDEVFYNQIGEDLQGKGFLPSIQHLEQFVGISDFGFPIVIKYIYSLGGNSIFIMKIFNIGFHLVACLYLCKISSLLVPNKEEFSKLTLILYGLNPIAVYFNASGRKEPLFILVIVITFYFAYKALLGKKIRSYLFAILFILSTGLFRTIFPIFILLSFGLFLLIKQKGKNRNIWRGSFTLVGLILLGLATMFLSQDLTQNMSVDKNALVEYRLGRAPGYLDYIIMSISGFIGPFPSFDYNTGNDSALLQTIGNFVKIFFSYFFLVGSYRIIKDKIIIFYPILLFILFNVIMLVSVAAALDHRFLFPFIPIYFIVIAYGFTIVKEKKRLEKFPMYIVAITTLMIAYNLR